MRAGLPVCGTDAGGTPEIIDLKSRIGLLEPRRGRERAGEQPTLMALESDEGHPVAQHGFPCAAGNGAALPNVTVTVELAAFLSRC